jgi:hypothetical protein
VQKSQQYRVHGNVVAVITYESVFCVVMATPFYDEIVGITNEARLGSVEMEKDASRLTDFYEKKIKDIVRQEASKGNSFVKFKIQDFNIDFQSKWSVEQLLYDRMFAGYVTVFERLFGDATPFAGFVVGSAVERQS